MHEYEHVELGGFVPERLERRVVDEFALELGGNHYALEAELMAATVKFFERRGAAKRMGVRGADKAPRIIVLGLRGFIVDQSRDLKIGAHAGGAGEPGRVDVGELHHAHVLVKVVEQRMHRVARRAERVVVQDKPVARIVLDQFARREMVLEVDDHCGRFLRQSAKVLAYVLAIVIPDCRTAASPESIITSGGYGFRAPRFARPRNDAAAFLSRSSPATYLVMA